MFHCQIESEELKEGMPVHLVLSYIPLRYTSYGTIANIIV